MILIQGCMKGDRESQKMLYKHYYGYAMSVCIRYAHSMEEAQEIMNDGFLKVFTKINQYDPKRSFKGWMRRIMINTAIDYFRSNKHHYNHQEIEVAKGEQEKEDVLRDLSYNEIIALVQKLSPGYRTVFSLYVIEGYSHEEIADKLGINVGTSKSNLSKARANLRSMLAKYDKEAYAKYSG